MVNMHVQSAMLSDIGRRRNINQDHGLAEHGLYLVCDGMGGGVAGQEASAITIDHFKTLADMPHRSLSDIAEALQLAQQQVHALGDRLGGVSGTTVTGLILADQPSRNQTKIVENDAQPASISQPTESERQINDGTIDILSTEDPTASTNHMNHGMPDHDTIDSSSCWYVVNVGDSRTYHLSRSVDGQWNASTLTQITHDHSRVQQVIDSGMMPPEMAKQLVPRNLITQCVGSPGGIHPDYFKADLPGRYIICSDGLYSEVEDELIATIAASQDTPQQVVSLLINTALEHGGSDNVTVVVVDVTDDESLIPADPKQWHTEQVYPDHTEHDANDSDQQSREDDTLDNLPQTIVPLPPISVTVQD